MNREASQRGVYMGVFLTSMATLFLQVLQTRIFSVMLWHHLTYIVVTFTLLGFAASGTFLSIKSRFFEKHFERRLAWVAGAFAVSIVIAFWTLTKIQLDTVNLLKDRVQYLYVFGYYIYLVIPYFLAGLAIAAALQAEVRNAPKLYAVNLLGSGIGCFLFIELLRPLGGSGSLIFAAAIAAAGALAFGWNAGKRVRLTCGVLLAGLLGLMPFAERLLVIKPAPSKAMALEAKRAKKESLDLETEETVWDPLCRLDVVRVGKLNSRMIYQDADAPTFMPGNEGPIGYQASVYSLAHHLIDQPDVLVIGVGGGHDLWHAYLNGSKSVTGAEINPTTVKLMRTKYREFSGEIYDRAGDASVNRGPVNVVNAEGRSFVRQSDKKYDLIQMTGTDTYTALSSGAYVMSESYLYTLEAFQDYLDHMNDDGLIAVLRFRFYPPRESLRLVAIASEAMRSRGIEDPSRCISVVSKTNRMEFDGKVVTVPYAVMIFKKGPFDEKQISTLHQFVAQDKNVYTLSYAPGIENPEQEFADFFEAERRGKEALSTFIENYRYNIEPVTDDDPFFFRFHRWSSVLEPSKSVESDTDAWFGVIGEQPVGLYILLTALGESTLLVFALVLIPLWFFRRDGLKAKGKLPLFVFFFGIGMGFMFLEISAMQSFVLYLGHPVYSITVVLASFLFFSGLGSLASGKISGKPANAIRLAVPAIVVTVLVYAWILPILFEATLGWSTPVRVIISVLLLGIPSFFMGMPFPSGLRMTHSLSSQLIPWVWGVNASASVIASVLAIILAMGNGFSFVFIAAAACYAIAGFAGLRVGKHANP